MARPPKVKKWDIKDKIALSIFPNFSASGSVIGMRKKYYGNDALLVRCGSYIYKVTQEFYDRAS